MARRDNLEAQKYLDMAKNCMDKSKPGFHEYMYSTSLRQLNECCGYLHSAINLLGPDNAQELKQRLRKSNVYLPTEKRVAKSKLSVPAHGGGALINTIIQKYFSELSEVYNYLITLEQ